MNQAKEFWNSLPPLSRENVMLSLGETAIPYRLQWNQLPTRVHELLRARWGF